jgi:hypothetical protein
MSGVDRSPRAGPDRAGPRPRCLAFPRGLSGSRAGDRRSLRATAGRPYRTRHVGDRRSPLPNTPPGRPQVAPTGHTGAGHFRGGALDLSMMRELTPRSRGFGGRSPDPRPTGNAQMAPSIFVVVGRIGHRRLVEGRRRPCLLGRFDRHQRPGIPWVTVERAARVDLTIS